MNQPPKRASLLSRSRAVKIAVSIDQSGIQWVSALHRSAHIQRRSLGQNLGVGTVDEGFWHKLVKGLLDMTAHPSL
jgi:hypothetical protein